MTSIFRVAWRVARFELVTLVIACVAVSAIAGFLSIRLDELAAQTPCVRIGGDCSAPDFNALARNSALVGLALMALPLAVGAILGSQLVAREIESGTAQFSWSYAGSRLRWLAERLTPLLLFTAIAMTPVASSALALQGSTDPTAPATGSLADMGQRGPVVVAKALAVLAAAALVGAIAGRTLPALLISVALAILFQIGTVLAVPIGEDSVPIAPMGNPYVHHAIVFGERYRSSAGDLLSFEDAARQAPAGEDPGIWVFEHFPPYAVGIPGSRYPAIELKLVIGLGALFVALLAACAAVVARRRPV